jgi:hypothetical protein
MNQVRVILIIPITDKRISAKDALNNVWLEQNNESSEVALPMLKKVLTNMKNFRVTKLLELKISF